MSVKASSWVWEHSPSSGTALAIELAIADWCDDDGKCWPGIERLARKARCTGRSVQMHIRKMEKAGRLTIELGAGPYGTNVYHLHLWGGEIPSPGGVKSDAEGVKSLHQGGEIDDPQISPNTLVTAREDPPPEDPSTDTSTRGRADVGAADGRVAAFSAYVRSRVTAQNFETWVARCHLVASGPSLRVLAPNEQTAEWLGRLHRVIDAAAVASGFEDVVVSA